MPWNAFYASILRMTNLHHRKIHFYCWLSLRKDRRRLFEFHCFWSFANWFHLLHGRGMFGKQKTQLGEILAASTEHDLKVKSERFWSKSSFFCLNVQSKYHLIYSTVFSRNFTCFSVCGLKIHRPFDSAVLTLLNLDWMNCVLNYVYKEKFRLLIKLLCGLVLKWFCLKKAKVKELANKL